LKHMVLKYDPNNEYDLNRAVQAMNDLSSQGFTASYSNLAGNDQGFMHIMVFEKWEPEVAA
jgi:hypothetical protein